MKRHGSTLSRGIMPWVMVLSLVLTAAPTPRSMTPYPTRPVRLISPWARGGTSDTAARLFANVAQHYIGQPVLVENHTGNGGLSGADVVHKGPFDGYTLLLAGIGCITGPASMDIPMPYAYNNFTMLGLLEINPTYCATSTHHPYTTIHDLLADIAQRPGEVRYGISGKGNVQHLLTLKLLDLAGFTDPATAAVPIHLDGDGAIVQALIAGEVDFYCSNMSAVLPYARKGQIKPIMAISSVRHSALSEIPTATELGFHGLEPIAGWSALFAPPELPEHLKLFWVSVLKKMKKDPSWTAPVSEVGSMPLVLSPQATRKFVESQYQRLSEIVDNLRKE